MSLVCFYQCGGCGWTSKSCGLSVPVPGSEPGRVEIAKAAEDLLVYLSEHRSIQQQQSVTEAHEQLTKEWGQWRTRSSEAPRHADEWSIETLDTKLKTVADNLAADHTNYELPSLYKRVTIQDILKQELSSASEGSTDDGTRSLISYQMQPSALNSKDILPLLIPLKPRQSRRCRAELADGRPGT